MALLSLTVSSPVRGHDVIAAPDTTHDLLIQALRFERKNPKRNPLPRCLAILAQLSQRTTLINRVA